MQGQSHPLNEKQGPLCSPKCCQQRLEESSIITASFHSRFYKNNGAEWQKLCLNTSSCTTWNYDGIQLRSEVILSKALKRLGDLSFIFKHDLVTEVTKPQVVHTGQLSELSFWILEDCSLKGTINGEARDDLYEHRMEVGGILFHRATQTFGELLRSQWNSSISIGLCTIMKGYSGSRLIFWLVNLK